MKCISQIPQGIYFIGEARGLAPASLPLREGGPPLRWMSVSKAEISVYFVVGRFDKLDIGNYAVARLTPLRLVCENFCSSRGCGCKDLLFEILA